MREFSEQEQVRRNRVEEIKSICNPYPDRFVVTHELKEAALLPDETKNVSVAGRIVLRRSILVTLISVSFVFKPPRENSIKLN